MRAYSLVGPGLMDAGLSSLATFAVGVYASRVLGAGVLGAYSLYFAGIFLSGLIPQQLYLLPARISVLQDERSQRIGVLRWTVPKGLMFGAIAGCLTFFAGAPTLDHLAIGDLLPLAVTASAVAVVSPVQDHLRQTLHLSAKSSLAAATSGVQLASVMIAIGALHVIGVNRVWVPFGALAFANVTSLAVAITLFARQAGGPTRPRPASAALVRSGAPLMVAELIGAAAGFIQYTLIATLVSVEALGALEAARVVAQPIFVFCIGVHQVMTPRLMEAGLTGSRESTGSNIRQYVTALVISSGLYLAFVGWSHPINVMEMLVPAAYVLAGLVALRVLAFMFHGASMIAIPILYGGRASRSVLLAHLSAAVTSITTVVLLAGVLGAYAMPVAMITGSLPRMFIGTWRSRVVLTRAKHVELFPKPDGSRTARMVDTIEALTD